MPEFLSTIYRKKLAARVSSTRLTMPVLYTRYQGLSRPYIAAGFLKRCSFYIYTGRTDYNIKYIPDNTFNNLDYNKAVL